MNATTSGHLFQIPVALLINFLGRAITLSIPYWGGRFSGSGMISSLQGKYPAADSGASKLITD